MTPGMAPTAMAQPSPIAQSAQGASAATPTMKLPAVTDDPNVRGAATSMGEMPKTPDLGSYLNPALNQYKSDLAGYQHADEANRIDPQKVKPRLWERLVGFGLGATQLKDPQNAGAVASEVVNRRRAGAEQSRATALAPWTQRLEMDKAGVPLAESAATTAYHQGELGLREATENRERFSAIKNAEAKEELNALREQWNSERDKNSQEKNAAYLQHIQDLAAKYKDDYALHQELEHLRERVQDWKEAKGDKAKDHTNQVLATEKTKEIAITAAEDKYRKARKQLDIDKQPGTEEYKQALAAIEDEHTNDLQRAENAYEVKGTELGGNIPHQDVASWQKGSQAAQPASTTPAATPAAKPKPAATSDEAPTKTGPAGEKPLRTAGQGKIGYYKSTGQWMLVPNSGGK
jgi:hypothetical protein